MSKIHLHSSIQRFANDYEIVDIAGNCTLTELLNRLIEEFSRLKPIIFTGNQISPYLVIFINGQDQRNLSDDFIVAANAEVEIITSLVGG